MLHEFLLLLPIYVHVALSFQGTSCIIESCGFVSHCTGFKLQAEKLGTGLYIIRYGGNNPELRDPIVGITILSRESGKVYTINTSWFYFV